VPDSCSEEGPLPQLLPFPPQAPSSDMYRISLSMRCRRSKGRPQPRCRAGSGRSSRATGHKAVPLFSSHSHIKSFYQGGAGCRNLHPAPTSVSGSLYYASGSSGMSPHSFLSTTTHKFHGNKSSYTIVRRAAPLTALPAFVA
jgi:hypothetical protein